MSVEGTSPPSDPRVPLATQRTRLTSFRTTLALDRTMLAWIRTTVCGWWNDDISNPFTVNGMSTSSTSADLDQAYGVEASTGVRGYGFTTDVKYQFVRGDLLVPTFTGGLYVNSATDMQKFLVNGGYILPCDTELRLARICTPKLHCLQRSHAGLSTS